MRCRSENRKNIGIVPSRLNTRNGDIIKMYPSVFDINIDYKQLETTLDIILGHLLIATLILVAMQDIFLK